MMAPINVLMTMILMTNQLSLNLSQQVLLMVPLRWRSTGERGGSWMGLPCLPGLELPCLPMLELPKLELPKVELPWTLLPRWGVRRRRRFGDDLE